MPTTFRILALRIAIVAAISAGLPMASAWSDQLTNGPNGAQPNTLDSESGNGSAGVAPGKEIYRQGSNLKPDSAQPEGSSRAATAPKTQN